MHNKGDIYNNINRCTYFVYISPVFSCRVTYDVYNNNIIVCKTLQGVWAGTLQNYEGVVCT